MRIYEPMPIPLRLVSRSLALMLTLCVCAMSATNAAESAPFALPELPYAVDALEPAIDAETMRIHHGRHHRAYVDNLNARTKDFPRLNALSLEQLQREISSFDSAVRNNGGGLTFDPRAVLDLDRLQIEWFDHVLRGKPKPQALADRVNYYVMGAEEWHSAPDLASVAPHRWNLFARADGATADSPFASGRLADTPADAEPPSSFVFDPRRGTQPADWALRPVDDASYVRDDDALRRPQLFFHSEPLTRARTLCGTIVFDARIAIDVPDTDVRVDLHAIDAENRMVWLGGDAMRARFRADAGRESSTEAGAVLPWRFNRFWWTCRKLDAGTRLRLKIGPVDDPYFQKNLNTGGRIGYERMVDARVATITLHHDRANPSVLRLPVVEAD
jgi:uncharacterized protein